MGTTLGYPAGVNPDQPTVIPFLKNLWATSVGVMTLLRRLLRAQRLRRDADIFLGVTRDKKQVPNQIRKNVEKGKGVSPDKHNPGTNQNLDGKPAI